MRAAALLAVLVACSGPAKSPAPLPASRPAAITDPLELLARSVGKPRVAATFDLAHPVMHAFLVGIDDVAPAFGGQTFAACGASFDTLSHVRVAVGEPLVIAAELDGAIDVAKARCILGDRVMQLLTSLELNLRDRPNGIALVSSATPANAHSRDADELVRPCRGQPACVSAVLGPRAAELHVIGRVEGTSLSWRLSGPGLSVPAADTFATAIADDPTLRGITAHSEHGELAVSFVDARDERVRRRLKEQLLEAFRVPSTSMVPTLLIEDNVFVVKGALRGPLRPGMVVVYRGPDDRLFIKRVMALGGQTVTGSEAGLAIDGQLLRAKLIDETYHYRDQEIPGNWSIHTGRLFDEELGGRSHRVVHTGPERVGTWTVPAGQVFLIGDNRENSNDSRFIGAVPEAAIVGRVLGVWLALRDGAPDWDRMGVGID